MNKVLCIYHSNCADGLGAAWAAKRALGEEVEFIAAKYGEKPPFFDVAEVNPETGRPFEKDGFWKYSGRDILIVDFSYSLGTLRAMAAEARSILVLDHHKTAREDLDQLDYPIPAYVDRSFRIKEWLDDPISANNPPNLAAIFDMNRSGAGLAWDYLHPGEPRPHIIDLIEDRDLWRFAFGDKKSQAFHAALTSYDITDLSAMFERLDEWNEWCEPDGDYEDPHAFKALLHVGHAILRSDSQKLRAAVAASRLTITIAGHTVPCANVPPGMASDAGHMLCKWLCDEAIKQDADPINSESNFSATYHDGSDGKRHFSLRSPEGGADVGQIAKKMMRYFNATVPLMDGRGVDPLYGKDGVRDQFLGGGHTHAAGFDAPLNWRGE